MNLLVTPPCMGRGLTLGIDVGTTATKALLLSEDSSWELHSWPSEEDMWTKLRNWLSKKECQIDRVGITTHGPSAVVINEGSIQGKSIYWFDEIPESCIRVSEGEHILPPTRAWVPSRIAQWELENGPLNGGIVVQLKDMYNWQITGEIARDSRSMRGFSGDEYMHLPEEVIGKVTAKGSELSGISEGAEVICGCDDLTAGVLGIGAHEGVLFNLANTSEHVGQVGGKYIDGMSWLPSLGRLPSISYNATPGRTESQPVDQNSEPVRLIRNKFPELEMWMGGGLANVQDIVDSRSAIVCAGSEVSALGVARLARRSKQAMIFGAGKVGRGFLAQLLIRSGWKVVISDTHSPTVRELKKAGHWTIFNLQTEEENMITVEEILLNENVTEKVLRESSLIMTSMGANHLEKWAHDIREILCKRLELGCIDLILAENHPRPAEAVRLALLENANEYQKILIQKNLGISQAQVLRSCIEPNSSQKSTTVQIQNHWTLPMDGDALLTKPDVLGFKPLPNFEKELTRKLFTYNCVNAMVCYIGYLKGYEWLSDAANDVNISELALKAGMESSAALVSAYNFDKNEQENWCNQALKKYQDISITDPIERNARDPVRKLGHYERLLGPIHLCMKEGLPFDNLLIGVAAALRYPGAEIHEELDLEIASIQLDSLLATESI